MEHAVSPGQLDFCVECGSAGRHGNCRLSTAVKKLSALHVPVRGCDTNLPSRGYPDRIRRRSGIQSGWLRNTNPVQVLRAAEAA